MSEAQLNQIGQAIANGDTALASSIARQLIEDPVLVQEAVDLAIDTIRSIGSQFEAGDIFLPEMIFAAETMQRVMEIFKPHLAGSTTRITGTVILATVKGDIHTIGKDIVATMLRASGYHVIDLGVDVSPMEIIQAAEVSHAQLLGLSALMTTSMPYQKEVIDLLNALKQRDQFWVILGGGPLTAAYARSVGANGWAASAAGAVPLSEQLLSSPATPTTAAFVAMENQDGN